MTKREFLQMKRTQLAIVREDLKEFADMSDYENVDFGIDVGDSLELIKDELEYIHSICKDIWKKA
jgi:hypothetical protein